MFKTIGNSYMIDQIYEGELLKRWTSVKEAAKSVEMSKCTLSRAARSGNVVAGCTWQYVKESEPTNEEWKHHPYLSVRVSNKGRVAVTKKYYGYLDDTGRYRVRVGKERKCYAVDRLVAETWLSVERYIVELMKPAKVRHLDGDGQNNVVENLEWY
jgi:hypothetical protein